jgi:lantibiotic modifying enzyme
MPLYETERHEALAGSEWSEPLARAALERIVADTHRGFSVDGLWPIHPADISSERPPAMTALYNGAAGVIWALHYLEQSGAVARGPDYLPCVRELVQRHRADLKRYPAFDQYLGSERASHFIGEAGMLLLHWKLEPSAQLAEQICAAAQAKLADTRGLLWGAAGSLLAALYMHERTGDDRWLALAREHVAALCSRWQPATGDAAWVWTDTLYGITETRLGALHGFMANAYAIARCAALLPEAERSTALTRIWHTAQCTALCELGRANWPHNVGPSSRREPMPLFVQFCSGAPGMIVGLSATPKAAHDSPEETLLREAGELVWHAGPTAKFPGLCHGAAGSGYALLKLYERTGDTRWLARARAFAMHAIERAERALDSYGQRKYSLWTGDLGLAVFLSACIREDARFPTLDVF